ncbi:OsmC family protein [Pseudochrobactrum sp. MP213Fo]|uniref:OsmC family protein n=1 Tax=Pseudochrobactrum sp. MP213Fo TaxID=3022250 RepID=UPI003B9F892B
MSFKEVFEKMQSVLTEQPEQAKASFIARSRLGEGFQSEVRIRQFKVNVDEPEALAGQDKAPNPVEYVLAALGSCQEITYRLYADALGIPLNGVSVKLTGEIDLRGFFNVDPAVRPGYKKITAEVTIDSPASPEDLARLRDVVESCCPVMDMLQNPTPVHVSFNEINKAAAA